MTAITLGRTLKCLKIPPYKISLKLNFSQESVIAWKCDVFHLLLQSRFHFIHRGGTFLFQLVSSTNTIKFFPEYLREGWDPEYQPFDQYLVTHVYNTFREIDCFQFPIIMQNNFNKQNKLTVFLKFKLETITQKIKFQQFWKKVNVVGCSL